MEIREYTNYRVQIYRQLISGMRKKADYISLLPVSWTTTITGGPADATQA